MRKSRFTEAQIVAIVREYDAGTSVAELARWIGNGISSMMRSRKCERIPGGPPRVDADDAITCAIVDRGVFVDTGADFAGIHLHTVAR